MSFLDNITVDDYYLTEEIPLVVEEDLVLEDNLCYENRYDLKSLPKGLVVKGDFHIRRCPCLKDIPQDMKVEGSLCVTNCFMIQGIPNTMEIGKSIGVKGCPDMIQLGQQFSKIDGNLELLNCPKLISLPKGLQVNGFLHLTNLRLGSIDKDVKIAGNVTIKGCKFLKRISLQSVGGNLSISCCRLLEQLEEGLEVDGNFRLQKCDSLCNLPDNIKIMGHLNITENAKLKCLPQNLNVLKNINIRNCSNLQSVKTLVVGEETTAVTILNCVRLTELFDSIEVDRLQIKSPLLVDLPRNIKVKVLDLSFSPNIILHEDLQVETTLNVDYCRSVTEIPRKLLQGRSTFLTVYMTNVGLSNEQLIELRDESAAYENVRLFTSINDGSDEIAIHSQQQGEGEDGKTSKKQSDLEILLQLWTCEELYEPLCECIDKAYHRDLFRFLNKLTYSQEFTKLSRESLTARVKATLLTIISNKDCRDEMLSRICDSLDACGDKPIWALNQMTVIEKICNARGDRKALKKLGVAIYNLQIVHKHVEEFISTLKFVDDVCVYLRFEIELKAKIELPVAATGMLYASYISVPQSAIDNAEKEVKNVTLLEYERWLETWCEWERQNRLEAIKSYKSLPKAQHDEIPEDFEQITNLVGEQILKPILFKGNVWCFDEFMDRWVSTGMDFFNVVCSVNDIQLHLKRIPTTECCKNTICTIM